MKQTPIKPMSAKREQQLRDAGQLAFGSTFQRPTRAMKVLPERPTKRHPRPKGPDNETVLRVLRRDRVCVVCGAQVLGGERGWAWSVHHRRGRDGRTDSHSIANLILVCGSDNVALDHGRIHQQRTWARDNGYWISRIVGTDPRQVPLFVATLGRSTYLASDGRYCDTPPSEAA